MPDINYEVIAIIAVVGLVLVLCFIGFRRTKCK